MSDHTIYASFGKLILDQYGGECLDNIIKFDMTMNGGHIPPGRVYVLEKRGVYPWRSILTLKSGDTLRIRSDYGGASQYKPQIWLYEIGTDGRPPAAMVKLGESGTNGAHINLRNISISGYNEDYQSDVAGVNETLIKVVGPGSSIYIDSCILKSTNASHIQSDNNAKIVKVTNSIFADMGSLVNSCYGEPLEGTVIYFGDKSIDSCIFENNTFINWQNSIVRSYAIGSMNYFKFNHNTLVNGLSYHGILHLGYINGGSMSITNNLVIDPFSLGNDIDAYRELQYPIVQVGLRRMPWIQAHNVSSAVMDISNNYYAISDSGQAFYNIYPYFHNEGAPLTYAINARLAALGKDTVNTFRKIAIQPINAPQVMTNLNRWYYTSGKILNNTNAFDYNRKSLNYYTNTLNCNFYSDVDLSYASTDGKVVGDTRWHYLGLPPSDTVSNLIYNAGWNLVSVPRVQTNYSASTIFPGTYGCMFKYDLSVKDYAEAPTLELGLGYWAYFIRGKIVGVVGTAPGPITVACKSGWNLIGSRERVVAVNSLQLSAGNTYGCAFRYDPSRGDYVEAAEIKQGDAIWIYVTLDCNLTIP